MQKAGSRVRPLPLMMALLAVGLSGCADQKSAASQSSAASGFPASIPEKPVDYASIGTPQESVEARLDRLEKNIADLRINYSSVEPAVKELAARNQVQEQRLAAVESAFGPMTASIRTDAPPPTTQTPQALPIVPKAALAQMQPVAELADLRGASGVEQPIASPSAKGWGVHLASYHTQAAAEKGWRELQATNPDLLEGLSLVTRPYDAGAKGQFLRVLAGPISDRTVAGKLCAAFNKRATWCEVLPLDQVRPSVAER